MIFGIGTDICDVRRIAAAQTRHGDRFAQRVMGPAELHHRLPIERKAEA